MAANEDCKGPRNKECGLVKGKILDNVTVHYEHDVLEDVAPLQVKETCY